MKKARTSNNNINVMSFSRWLGSRSVILSPESPPIRKKRREPATIQTEERPRANRINKTGIHFYPTICIGRGSTATVYEGYFRDPIDKAAIKCINAEFVNILKNEIDIWRKVDDSQNVVRLKDHKPWNQNGKLEYYIAMELASTTLLKVVKDGQTDRPILIKYLKDAAEGLAWIFSKNIIHRDVKPDNILIFPNNRAKLGDFGVSKKLTSMTLGTDSSGKTTLDWAAPEVITAVDEGISFFNKPCQDIFSLGLTIYFTLNAKHPFGGIHKISNIANPDKEPELIPPLSSYTENKLIYKMLNKRNPKERPSIDEVLKHPMFWGPQRWLHFIQAVASSYEDHSRNVNVKMLRQSVDIAFSKLIPNWRSLIPEIKPYIFKDHTKFYTPTSAFKLVELIRDKYTHREKLSEELYENTHFVTDGEFDTSKYIGYFQSKFPNFVTFLYENLRENDDKYLRPRSLRTEYYSD